ncbi:MAG: alpha/beta fold hydrolase [Chitinivibrionales bacterium]|nr:alpha/beta fold hydrolase [Chitinivibrionales bacterium]
MNGPMKQQATLFSFSCLSILLLFPLSCLRLDSFLFEGTALSAYSLDAYTGKQECSDAIVALTAAGYPKPLTREIVLKSGSETIYGVLLYTDSLSLSKDTCILYFHGNANHLDYYWQRCRLLCAVGYPVFAIDYRGFGKSSGKPTEDGLYEDGRIALSYVNDSLGLHHSIVYAYSLGSLIGCDVTSTETNGRIIGLVLEAPIGSIATLVEDGSYLNFPTSFVSSFSGDNIQKIKTVTLPLFWLHGTRDGLLKRESHGLPVWNNCPAPYKKSMAVDGAEHGNIPTVIGYLPYVTALKTFIHHEM